jgi:tetratricopeptide (TPR) repeat protein
MRKAEGRLGAAEPVYIRARDIGDALLAEEPDDPETLVMAGAVHNDLSRAEWDLGKHSAAEISARRAMEIAGTLTALEPSNKEHRNRLASAQSALGITQMTAGHLEKAVSSFRESVANREALVSAEPNNTQYRRQLLISYGHLGDVLGFRIGESLGDTAGAAAAFTRAVELARWAQESDPSDHRARFDLASGKMRLGTMMLASGARSDALRELTDAEKLIQSLMADGPRNDRYAHVESVVQARIGDAYAALDNGPEAVRRLGAARASSIRLLSGTLAFTVRQHFVQTTVKLAHLKAGAGDPDAARLADEVIAALRKNPIGGEMLEALIYQEVGLTFGEISKRTNGAARAAAQQSAAGALETAAAKWRSATLPPALEPTRATQLATIEKALAGIVEIRR